MAPPGGKWQGKHRSRPWVGDFASVLCPLVVVTMFMRKRSVEDVADIGHRVDADGRALEDGALDKHTRVKHPERKSEGEKKKGENGRCYPAVVKTA